MLNILASRITSDRARSVRAIDRDWAFLLETLKAETLLFIWLLHWCALRTQIHAPKFFETAISDCEPWRDNVHEESYRGEFPRPSDQPI